MKLVLLILSLLFTCKNSICQDKNDFNLGTGLFIFKYNIPPAFNKKPVALYNDSACTSFLTDLAPEKTDCPECMLCAEPSTFYKGAIHTFICSGYQGIALVCNKQTAKSYELFIDTSGKKAYALLNSKGKFYSWDAYMQQQARQGEYFSFNRQWDTTVLYDKPYPLDKLPAANKALFVKVNFKNIADVRFYPVKTTGYWMKLKAAKGKKILGYCWFIWRTEKNWKTGFTWRS